MRTLIDNNIDSIRKDLSSSPNLDYYNTTAEFVGEYKIRVGGDTITGKMIFLCTGSKPIVPPIQGIEQVGYHTSDTILHETKLPESIAIMAEDISPRNSDTSSPPWDQRSQS
jgi:dihydrolipoamide dehydrogenase